LGRLHPIGVVLAAFLFGALHVGGATVDRVTEVPRDITVIMQAMVILFIAAPRLMSFIRGQR